MATPLLSVRNLVKHFEVSSGGRRDLVRAVDGVDLSIAEGETLGLVGESGCGKSTLGRLILRLLEPTAGKIIFAGRNLLERSGKDLRDMRREIQVVFQDPSSSLDPRQRVGDIVGEGLEIHALASGAELKRQVGELLERVGLGAEAAQRFPHQLSGGQRQRVGIARALALRPRLIVADEPVSALDVSVQAQILNLLQDLQEEYGLAYLFIAHDLRVVEHICHRVAIMYLGQIVELADSATLFAQPKHPYTRVLMSAVPTLQPGRRHERLRSQGEPPSPIHPPEGCRFHPRCAFVQEACRQSAPKLKGKNGHEVSCHVFGE